MGALVLFDEDHSGNAIGRMTFLSKIPHVSQGSQDLVLLQVSISLILNPSSLS